MRAALRLKKADDVSISVVNRDGDVVRDLVTNRHVGAKQKTTATWDGRDDAGRRAPDGFYRFRLGLRDSGPQREHPLRDAARRLRARGRSSRASPAGRPRT